MFHHIEIIILINQEVHIILNTIHLHTVDQENNPFHRIDIILALEITQTTVQDNLYLIHQTVTQIILLHPNQIIVHRTIVNQQKDRLKTTVLILHIQKMIQMFLTTILTYKQTIFVNGCVGSTNPLFFCFNL